MVCVSYGTQNDVDKVGRIESLNLRLAFESQRAPLESAGSVLKCRRVVSHVKTEIVELGAFVCNFAHSACRSPMRQRCRPHAVTTERFRLRH